MSVNVSCKSLNFEHFTIHHLSFKNINASDFDELYDTVNEYLFKENAIIISSNLTGNRSSEKTIKKALKKVFDEANWPVNWIGNTKDSKFSGDFEAVSGVNVKVLLSSNFILKVFDTANLRFAFLGNVLANSESFNNQTNGVSEHANAALSMVGLSYKNTIRSWYYCDFDTHLIQVDANFIGNEIHPVAETIIGTGNQFNKKMMASFIAVEPKNTELKIESTKGGVGKQHAILVGNQNSKMLLISRLPDDMVKSPDSTVEKAIENSIQHIETIIHQNNFNWSQLWRGIAYFKNANDIAIFKNLCKVKHIPLSALLLVQVNFYDESKFFDIEADFVTKNEE